MNIWDDLLLTGGFAPRARLLAGLTLDEVGMCPSGAPHSIYQELWHAAMCQQFTLEGGMEALGAWPWEEHFPITPEPASQREWDDLVEMFLEGSEQAVQRAEDRVWLEAPEHALTDWTWRNSLEFLTMHSAYHLGKIVLLRQILGLWPPPNPETADEAN